MRRKLPVLGKPGGNLHGQTGIDFETHLGKLHTDVGHQLSGGDGIQQLVIDICGLVGFSLVADAFAQGIECCQHAVGVEPFGCAESVFDFEAGNESGAEAASHAGILAELAKRLVS